MSSPDIFPAVEAGNVQALRGAETKIDYRRIRRKATRQLLIRAAIAIAIAEGSWLALRAGLLAWQLAIPFQSVAMIWFAVWFGAWLQFMWCKEGLLQ